MKKFLILTLVLILALSLAACNNRGSSGNDGNDGGGGTDNESADSQDSPGASADAGDSIVGTWVYSFDVSGLLQEEIGAELAVLGDEFATLFSDLGSAVITILFEFNADGTYRMYADEDSLYSMISNVMEHMIDAIFIIMEAMFEEMAEGLGMSVDDLIAAYEEEEGIAFSDIMDLAIEEMLDEMGDFNELFGDISDTGRYKVEGDRLFAASVGEEFEHYEVFEISGNTLTLLSTSDPDFDTDEFGGIFSYPAQLTRR